MKGGRKEGKKEGSKEGKNEGRKEGKEEGKEGRKGTRLTLQKHGNSSFAVLTPLFTLPSFLLSLLDTLPSFLGKGIVSNKSATRSIKRPPSFRSSLPSFI